MTKPNDNYDDELIGFDDCIFDDLMSDEDEE